MGTLDLVLMLAMGYVPMLIVIVALLSRKSQPQVVIVSEPVDVEGSGCSPVVAVLFIVGMLVMLAQCS